MIVIILNAINLINSKERMSVKLNKNIKNIEMPENNRLIKYFLCNIDKK